MSAPSPPRSSKFVRVIYAGRRFDVPRDFVEEIHPGGPDSILFLEDLDITEQFEAVGHSEDAMEMLQGWAVDPFSSPETETVRTMPTVVVAAPTATEKKTEEVKSSSASTSSSSLYNNAMPVAAAVVCGVIGFYVVKKMLKK